MVSKTWTLPFACGVLICFFYYYNNQGTQISYTAPIKPSSGRQRMPSTTPSSLKGWHSRATTHPSPESFTPTKSNVALAVLLNAPADPEGYTLTLFNSDSEENIVVDAAGRVLLISKEDFTGLSRLGTQAVELPETGSFRNTWAVAHDTTSQPIDRFLIPTSGSDDFAQVSVQGYSEAVRQLKKPVGEFVSLPDPLYYLAGLVQEGRDGFERGRENTALINRIKSLLGEI